MPLAADVVVPLVHRIVAIVIAMLVVAATVEMIRRRKLREEYAMLWLGASLVLLVLAVFPSIPFLLQRVLNINYLTIVVLACFLFLAMILMHFAVVISKQSEQVRQLAERMAILRRRLAELERDAATTDGEGEARPSGPATNEQTGPDAGEDGRAGSA